MAVPLTPGRVEDPQGSDVTPGGIEYPQGGDEPMNDSYHFDDAMLGTLGTGPVTPGGPYRPQGSGGVKAIPFSCGKEDLVFAVERVLRDKPAKSASTRAADEVGVEESDDEAVFDGTENLLPSTSMGARPPKAPKMSARGKSKKAAAAEVE